MKPDCFLSFCFFIVLSQGGIHVKCAGNFWFILYSLACSAMLIIPIILKIEAYMDSALSRIGVIKKKILIGICSEDLMTVCLFSLRLLQNLVLIVF